MRNCIVVLVGLFVCGCSTNSTSLTKVNVGMTKAQVVQALGQPESATGNNQNEYLIYHLRERMSRPDEPWPLHEITERYFVSFKNGLVDAYGKTADQEVSTSGNNPLNRTPPQGSSPYNPVYVAPAPGIGGTR